MGKDQGVSIKVDRRFFDEIFEPKRKEFENKMGVRIGQEKFTKLLHAKKIKLKLPKQRINIKNKSPRSRGFNLI